MSHDHQPLDMNKAFSQIAQQTVQANTPAIMASTMLTIADNLRRQGHQLLGDVQVQELITVPALLEGDRSLALVPYFRSHNGMFRLIVSHSTTGERVFTAFQENENNTLQTQYLKLSDFPEYVAELERQMDAVKLSREGYLELGLLTLQGKIEGYEYFVAPVEEKKEEVAAPATATENFSTKSTGSVDPETPPIQPAALTAPAPVSLSDAIPGDVM